MFYVKTFVAFCAMISFGCEAHLSNTRPDDAQTKDAGRDAANDGNLGRDANSVDAAIEMDSSRQTANAPFDWNGIIGTGQSLSVGGNPVVHDREHPSVGGLRLWDNGGDEPFDGNGDQIEVQALNEIWEPLRSFRNNPALGAFPWPHNLGGETPHSGFADAAAMLAAAWNLPNLRTAHIIVGDAGQPLARIKFQGSGTSFAGSISETRLFFAQAQAQNQRFGIAGVLLTHGEADCCSGSYRDGMVQLLADYRREVATITGQTFAFPMFLSQPASFPLQAGSRGLSPLQMLEIANTFPSDFVMIGPKYQYPYIRDGVHMNGPGYAAFGEKAGEAFFYAILSGNRWRPLEPIAARANSAREVRVEFFVPYPPLQFVDGMFPAHEIGNTEWRNGRGFEVSDAQGSVVISSVRIDGNAVIINLERDLSGGPVVRYAMTQDLDPDNSQNQFGLSGYPGGRIGHLADSDPFTGVEFELPLQMTNGSGRATRIDASNAVMNRLMERDRIAGTNLFVARREANNDGDLQAVVLSGPWQGNTGPATIRATHDHRNFAVQFERTIDR